MNKCIIALNSEKEKIKNYIFNNKILVIIIFFFGILSFGFYLCNFTIGIDTEYAISSGRSPSSSWVAQGRFGVGVLKKIFSTNQILPFRNTFLAITLMIINTILLCYILKPNNKKNTIIYGIIISTLYITSPIFVHNLYFTTYNFEIQIGILLCLLSCYISSNYILENNKNRVLFLLPVLLMSFCIGIYQSFLSFYFALVCYKIIDHLIELKHKNKIMECNEFVKIIIKYTKVIILSMILYYIIDKIFSIFIPRGNYIDTFIGWKRYSFNFVFNNIKEYIKGILIDNQIIGTGIILYTCIISGLLILYYGIFKKSLRIYVPVLTGLIMLSPFILTIVLGSEMPYRSQQTLILITPLIFGIMYNTINNNYIKNIICIFVILVGFNQSMYTNKLLYSDYVRYQQDLDLTREINNKINELEFSDIEKYKVICVGKIENKQTSNILKQELIGYSIYEWDGGNPSRISAFLNIHEKNHANIYEWDKEDIQKAKEYSTNMPVWPNEGCVKLFDNIIVVKLSEIK